MRSQRKNNNEALAKFLSQSWGLCKLMRPKQWVKNGFVLAPLMFSGEFMDLEAVSRAMFAMFLFCVASSAVYIINDIHDIENDRRHPRKSKTRPLAAGIISIPAALTLLAVLYTVLVLSWFIAPKVMLVIIAYSVLNLAYTFKLKYLPVIDIFVIAIGFVLRVYAGAMAVGAPVSSWMFITTLCLALYLASVKRQQELKQSGSEGRKTLEKYTVALVDRYAEMSATGALLFYSMFVMSARPELVITIPLVLFGLFRYWFVVEALEGGESPTDALFADWPLLLTVILWVSACIWSLWPGQG
ncbi:decaprenyl-phosphate phosphoribosyltransferase [Kluyvera ascorbata]|uniref:decaprenyl-phosphate phosphoribosyltransferase n=2 Tax=Kluyvera ascorbata TaxID=51288 RepID=UPI0018A61CD2|nr:decaprenyl-phosphate phosphoribosyltransferase [Kluyvera ascorbata]BBV68050.1 decaprenyl-phosphate phosphoribosyltransferase [Klebsiella sp. STW0522-44]MDU3910992.1 decaprenyl-phosphate phosphoribosyltransferase [Kluyvera ascorbata]HAT7514756.1 decaprenyl-phosphate phosphoribosyltransferase [Kluyvera ascorbata]HCL5621753.1 decaprenyl-phosphate phosphoribosyltransferase [Kluyvera ascorbata]HDG1663270.1 decaprenyl-phosphate phosphoribosyltransferase [Kluyvera ascorbata]